MKRQALETIENEVTDFIRRIVLSERRDGSLDRSSFVILRQLTTHGPAGVKSLAKELNLDISTISRQAATLVDKQYVEKVPNPDDGRAFFYQITEPGKKILEENRQRRFEGLERALEEWTEEECASFAHLLKKYNHSVIKEKNKIQSDE
ncbi:MarR family winged helix-turn-helix transcriptional regulator [Virgibacillus sp. SK37]|uniref:MarR family winged helix-turn-helix transcriptional regulator n=1 Tax=Virgibacillus sp. SK37 TaxID=403957 RepID=UPI0004D1A20A|nr:MarR family transcriptional regulator [Virgibacillus sp. SK37]AIF44946.1 MarR family transcriptional regulator [Virgibacillus sp. SK37]